MTTLFLAWISSSLEHLELSKHEWYHVVTNCLRHVFSESGLPKVDKNCPKQPHFNFMTSCCVNSVASKGKEYLHCFFEMSLKLHNCLNLDSSVQLSMFWNTTHLYTIPKSCSKYILWYPLPNLCLGGPGQLGKFKTKGTIWITSCPFEKIDFFWFMAFLGKKVGNLQYFYTGNL